MATLDDGPMMNEGQSWISWADTTDLKISNRDNEEEKIKVSRKKHDNDAMKLRKEEMGLFGLCPAWDDFFLVVCEICGRLVKPQALKGHLELRHASSLDRPWDQSELPVPHSTSGKSSSGGGASTGQRHASSMQQPSSQQQTQMSQQQQHLPGGRSASVSMYNASNATLAGSAVLNAVTKSATGSATQLPNHARHPVAKAAPKPPPPPVPVPDAKFPTPQQPPPSPTTSSPTPKKNHGIDPIVRVERIAPNAVMKKVTSNSSGKELPSPQQPPPAHPAVPIGVLGSTSGPGPGAPNSCLPGTVQNVGRLSPLNVALGVRTGEQEVVPVTRKLPLLSSSLKNKKVSKERKLLLCKDREYDPNKHCGVITTETSKPCTRSLTCKTHSLSLRRAVSGRKKHFDELLSDHRATKEALLKKARSGDPSQHALLLHPLAGSDTGSSKTSNKMNHSSGGSGSTSSNIVSSLSKSTVKSSNKQNSLPTHRLGASSSSSCKSSTDVPQSLSSVVPPLQRVEGATAFKNSSVSPSFPTPDPPYASHHPKPAAMCTFGMWQFGGGRPLLGRHWEQPRAALKAALFAPPSQQQQHHPPQKKLCLEPRLPSVSQLLDTSDPYRFICAETNNNILSSSHLPSSNSSPLAAPVGAVGASTNSTITPAEKPKTPGITRPLVPTVSNPQLARSLSLQPQPLLAKCTTNAQPTAKTKPAKAPPKSDTNKIKNSSTNRHCSSTTTTNHSAPKKRRINSNSVSSKLVVVTTAGATTVTVSAPQTVTIAAAPHPTATTLPISFPLTISGDQLGAFSRLQMPTPLVMSRNSLTLAPNLVRNQSLVTTANSKDNNTVVMDMLNGQLPLLHSVTVSRTARAASPALLTAGPGGLGITLGAAGLMGQLTQQLQQQQQQKLASNNMVQLSANKVSNTNWTPGGGSTAKTKYKGRKSKSSNVTLNHHHHHQTGLSSPIGLLIEGQPLGGGLLTTTIGGTSNSHLSSSPASSPSPILRTDGLSPLLVNGLSSPTLCGGKLLNSGGLQHSPASRTSTPSPGVIGTLDLSSPAAPASGQGNKGKGRHTSSFAKSVTAGTMAHHHSSLSFPMAIPVAPRGCSTASTAVTQSISYQQVFASQMLTPAQITHIGKKNSGAPITLTTTALPLKLPLLSQQQNHLFVNSGDDSRRTEDHHSLPT